MRYDMAFAPVVDPFPAELARLASTFKALAHPARLALLQVLAERGTCVCGTLVDQVPLAQSTVSQHLKVLKQAGLITGEVDGPRSCYCIEPGAVQELTAMVTTYTSALSSSPACSAGGDGSPC
jgi:ArsR family transcriptional regulator